MGKDSGNTTNSWLNLAKVLELAINDGRSAISGQRIAPTREELGLPADSLKDYESIKKSFYVYLDYFLPRMAEAANACTEALALAPVPFHSAFMGGRTTGIDMRDFAGLGTPYNGSGCLIHGLANVADSFTALKYIDEHGSEFGFSVNNLVESLKSNFEDNPALRDFLLTKPTKYGNNDETADREAAALVEKRQHKS